MVKKFIYLEWKQFVRSSYFGQKLAVKILAAFGILYFAAAFIFLGMGAFFIIEEELPGTDPLEIINNYLIYWFAIDLVYRFMLQKLPTLNIQPLLVQPIPRKAVIHFLLGKTLFSIFNLFPLLFYIPFSIVLFVQDYNPYSVVAWFILVLSIEITINYLTFLINKSNSWFYSILVALIGTATLQYFDIFDIPSLFGLLFNRVVDLPFIVFLPLTFLLATYYITYKYVRKDFYLDERLKKGKEGIKNYELSWLDRFGTLSTFLKNDIRLILRNKRPKQTLSLSAFLLFYGLIFYTNEQYVNSPYWLLFVSMMITGGFSFSFGQYVPSWDSEYFKLLMSQNISYRKYLESKWFLMTFSVVVFLILSLPYLYFGWEIYQYILVTAVFNIGINSHLTLLGGAFNKNPIRLNNKAKAFENFQNFSMKQVLVSLPKIFAPALIYAPFALFSSHETGMLAILVVAILGIVLKKQIIGQIENLYQEEKYKTIQAYSEKN